MAEWSDLAEELRHWSGAGRRAGFWWRDDDAVKPGPRLQQLGRLSRQSGIAVALAVIPGQAEDSLAAAAADWPDAGILVHGLQHANHAPDGEKKAEFGPHRPVHEMLGDAAIAWQNLRGRFGTLARPVFVPPWNRIDEQLVGRLPLASLAGISRYGPRRAAMPVPGLRECNCHLDLIDWRGSRGFIGREAALEALIGHLHRRREGSVDAAECSGVLSHHAVMDQPAWDFLAELFERTGKCDGAHWLTINEVFRLPQ